METILHENFTNLLLALEYKKTYRKAIEKAKASSRQIQKANIVSLTPYQILTIYRNIANKFYIPRIDHQIQNDESWFENQLRVFVWLLIGYSYTRKKSLEQMSQNDWKFFRPIFNNRSSVLFEHEAKSILSDDSLRSKSKKWSKQELKQFVQIMEDQQQQVEKKEKTQSKPHQPNEKRHFNFKWKYLARELYIRSNKQYFRTSKECRQKWNNHLDPNKRRSGFDIEEDFIILRTVHSTGNRWAEAAKALNETRTQNAVKNRYHSLISQMRKGTSQKLSSKQCQQRLIEQLGGAIEKRKAQRQNGNKTEVPRVCQQMKTKVDQEKWAEFLSTSQFGYLMDVEDNSNDKYKFDNI